LEESSTTEVLLIALVKDKLFVEIIHGCGRVVSERARERESGGEGYFLGDGRVQESGLVIMRTIIPSMASYSA
jgi:hypothetical protein